MENIKRDIVQKTIDGLAEEGMKYVGTTLYSTAFTMVISFAQMRDRGKD